MQSAEADAAVQRWEVQRLEEEIRQLDSRLEALREQVRREKDEHLECMRQAARLQNDAVSYRAQVDNLTRERHRLHQRREQAVEHLASLDLELQELTSADETLQGRLARPAKPWRSRGRSATRRTREGKTPPSEPRTCRAAERSGESNRDIGRSGKKPRRIWRRRA